MKTTLLHCVAAAAIAASSVTAIRAADHETPQSVRAHGTITSNTPDTIMLRSDRDAAPVSYTFTKETQYVNEAGQPVSAEIVRTGVPVTVQYTRDGDRLIANRVTVYAPTQETQQNSVDRPLHTTETTRQNADGTVSVEKSRHGDITTHSMNSHGTINARTPDQFVIKSEADTSPQTYIFTSSTQYVNDRGQTVSAEVVKTGVPVTVEYEREGDRLRATRVIVHDNAATTSTVRSVEQR